MIPIDPPITFRPSSFGRDPEPLGSDRFALMISRAIEDAALSGPAAARFNRASPAAADPAGTPPPPAIAV